MISRIKSFINKFNKSKDGKVLASNFGYMMLLQIAGYIFPLITIPYVARTVGVEGVGKIAVAAAVVMWFQTITDWGFNYTATRDVANNRNNQGELSKILTNVFWSKILLMIVSFLMLNLAIIIFPYFKTNSAILYLTFLIVPGNVLYFEWMFQGLERMKYITLLQLVSKLMFVVLVFCFINSSEDFIYYPLFMGCGYIVIGLISIYIVNFKWRIKINLPDFSGIKYSIKNSSSVFLSNFSPNLYTTFSSVLLGGVSQSSGVANGILDAGYKFAGVAQQFMVVVSRVFFPFLSRKLNYHNGYAIISVITSLLFTIALFFFSPLIINFFYTPDFLDAINVLRIFSFSVFFNTLSNVYGVNYLVAKGHDVLLRNITLIFSFIGMVLAVPLVYFNGYIGAAIAITGGRLLVGCATVYFALKIMRNKTSF